MHIRPDVGVVILICSYLGAYLDLSVYIRM
jgi:hypothetical protein